jgi:hypothetical protein
MTQDRANPKEVSPSSRTTIRLDVHAHLIPLRNADVNGLPGLAWTPAGLLDITMCLAHGGGVTAAVAGRLERGQTAGRSGIDIAGEMVTQTLQHFYVDGITHDAAALQLVATTHGADRVLFGSDWPFVMGLSDPHRQLAGVDPRLLQRIFVDNPERLLRATTDSVDRVR